MLKLWKTEMSKFNKITGGLVVLGGLAVIGTTFYWGSFDYNAAYRVDKMLTSGKYKDKDLVMLMYKADAHRMNVWFEGTWLIMGGILSSVGLLIMKD